MLIRKDTLRPWRGEAIGDPPIRHPSNIEGAWTVPELSEVGLVRCVPFVTPPGKQLVGLPTYSVFGVETYVVEDIPPPTAAEIDAGKEAYLDNSLESLQWKLLFDIFNDVRTLKGQGVVTAAQFRAAMKARL